MTHSPQIMGILNITPDSFYDGNKYSSSEDILSNIQELKKTDIVDVGCESSRPGSKPLTIEEEAESINIEEETKALGPNAPQIIDGIKKWGQGLVSKGVWSDEDFNEPVLDTHILRYLTDVGYKNVPKSTPQNPKIYEKFANLFKRLANFEGMSVADFDLKIWKQYSYGKSVA